MKRGWAWLAAGGLAAGLLITGGLVGGIAFAGGDDTVDACYHLRSGAVRVDVAGTGCKRNEQPITLGGSGAGLTTRIVTAERTLPPDGFGGVVAECAAGEVVLGGGMQIASINSETAIVTNAPHTLDDGRQGWQLTVSAGGPVEVWAFAVCAPGVTATG